MKKILLFFVLFTLPLFLHAVQVAEFSNDGTSVLIDAVPERVDVARDFYVTVSVKTPKGVEPVNPDLRDRFQGFRIAEDFAENPSVAEDGSTTCVSRWRLVPEPFAPKYRLAPFAVGEFYTKPVVFEPPEALEPVTGEMEINPEKDFPPLSWKLVGIASLALLVLAALVVLVVFIVKKIRLAIRLRKMSPIERAYWELGELFKKGLPGRGFYKDFYVELTMVVRRYIERRHGVKAPNLTTYEFLIAARNSTAFSAETVESLKKFLESADMVKFANMKATPEMADAAGDSAKAYLDKDDKERRNA